MTERNFMAMVRAKWDEGKFVCVGLDTVYEKIPEAARIPYVKDAIMQFNVAIVDATKDLVCAYKPNYAFYLRRGDVGLRALQSTIAHILHMAPDVPVIVDMKCGDTEDTNREYAAMAFEYLKADALTVHNYMGGKSLQPFLEHKDKGVFVLCRTSNPGAEEIQEIEVGHRPLYLAVAKRVAKEWNKNNNCGLVTGATAPEAIGQARRLAGDLPLLIPGIGKQKGDFEKTIKNGKDSRDQGMIINSSRGIIYASSGPDFAAAARRETMKLRDEINRYR